jgi:hypothetical protein
MRNGQHIVRFSYKGGERRDEEDSPRRQRGSARTPCRVGVKGSETRLVAGEAVHMEFAGDGCEVGLRLRALIADPTPAENLNVHRALEAEPCLSCAT